MNHKQRSRHRAAFYQTLPTGEELKAEYDALPQDRKDYCEGVVRAIEGFDSRDTHPDTLEPLDGE